MRFLSIIILLFTSLNATADYFGSTLSHSLPGVGGAISPQGEVYTREILESIAVLEEQFSANEHTRLVFSFETQKIQAEKYSLNVRICVKGRSSRFCFHEATTTVGFISDRLGLLLREIYLSNLSKSTLKRMANYMKENKLEVRVLLKRVTPWYLENEILAETQIDFMSALQSGNLVPIFKLDNEIQVGLQFQN